MTAEPVTPAAATSAATSPAPQALSGRRPFLRVVRNPSRPARKLPFVLLVVGLLGVALVGLLVLNTQRAQLSFTATTLQARVNSLQDQQQQLQREVEGDRDPATLASRAAALGMAPETQPGFVDAAGHVVGAVPSGAPVPAPGAVAQDGIVVAGPVVAPKVIAPSRAAVVPSASTAAATPSAVPTAGAAPSATVPATAGTAAADPSATAVPTPAVPSSRSTR